MLDQLSVDKDDKNGVPRNPWLRDLNNDWENQRDKADIMIIAGAGIPTVTGGPGLTVFGDGVVTRRSAKLDGVQRKSDGGDSKLFGRSPTGRERESLRQTGRRFEGRRTRLW
ncbi:MAG TPA: hypothetical protein EYO33_13520 [Phycisphaerales bacterium]|nr:hypothetical protein [Phycisphaerales bacterium]